MRVDIKVPFKCEPIKAIQDVNITLAISLSESDDTEAITRRIFAEKYPTIKWDEIDFNNLEQDDYSKSTYNVFGFFRIGKKPRSGIIQNKLYLKQCITCSKKTNIFGLGYYLARKPDIIKNVISCGCSSKPYWTKYQNIILIHNIYKKHNSLFLKYEKYDGDKTKCYSFCKEHLSLQFSTINQLKKPNPSFCNECGDKRKKEKLLIDDNYHISQFFNTGKFHKDTIFWRSERKTSTNRQIYWKYKCPICSMDEYTLNNLCNGIFESYSPDLKKGILSCRCSPSPRYTYEQVVYKIKKTVENKLYKQTFLGFINGYKNQYSKVLMECEHIDHENYETTPDRISQFQSCPRCGRQNQQYAYINSIELDNNIIALKYGIENTPNKRVKKQNYSSIYNVKTLYLYHFNTVDDCKSAENECKKLFGKGILSKKEMPDGYTETTSTANIDKIIDIYEKWGGIKQ